MLTPYIESARERHESDLWIRSECYRFYVEQRRQHCSSLELMDLWLRAPYCEECIQSDPFFRGCGSDIGCDDWIEELTMHLGDDVADSIANALSRGDDPAFLCKRCHRALRPWDRDEIYIVTYHLEEYYRIPLETPGCRNPAERVKRQVIELYDRKCFACGATTNLGIDHIMPRSRGGDAAFRNLQPLCERCGNEKGNKIPSSVEVYSDMYFTQPPSDSYEGMFW